MYDILMSDSKGYYAKLGVSADAKPDDIKKAYRRLSLQYHPDKTGNDKEATNKYKEINEAYEILGDEGKRKQYDIFSTYAARYEDKFTINYCLTMLYGTFVLSFFV